MYLYSKQAIMNPSDYIEIAYRDVRILIQLIPLCIDTDNTQPSDCQKRGISFNTPKSSLQWV